jgi:hypothetical protein
MKIISFAWTSEAFEAGRKTVTRREWAEKYAQRFKVGDICQAYDKQPRFGGKLIGTLKIESKNYEHISTMPDDDFENEGLRYMQENNINFKGEDAKEAFENWRKQDKWYWVIRFKPILVICFEKS